MSFFHEYLALDIGTHSVKLLSLDPGPEGHGFSIRDALCEVLPVGMISGGFRNPTIQSEVDFKQFMGWLVGKVDDHKRGAIVGLPDRWVKLHLVEEVYSPELLKSPTYMKDDLRRKLCPPKMENVDVDYQILSTEETNGGIRARCMAGLLQRSVLEQLGKIFMDLKMEIMAFDTSTLGIYNLLEEFHPEKTLDQNKILVHVGHETTVVKIFEHGVLRYERVIEVAGEAFSQILAAAEGCQPADALKLMPDRDFFSNRSREDLLRQIDQRHLFDKMFGNWLRELHVTFRFYQEKFRISRIHPIYLTGGSSLFAGLPEFLGDFFGTPCQRYNPFTNMPWAIEPDPGRKALGTVLAPCLGLLAH